MEASRHLPEAAHQPVEFSFWTADGENWQWRHLNLKDGVEHHVGLDGVYLGLLHLETATDGQIAYIDGIDFESDNSEVVELADWQWEELAFQLYAKGIIKTRDVKHPGSPTPFLEVV